MMTGRTSLHKPNTIFGWGLVGVEIWIHYAVQTDKNNKRRWYHPLYCPNVEDMALSCLLLRHSLVEAKERQNDMYVNLPEGRQYPGIQAHV